MWKFAVVDYVIFGLSLLISVGIGVANLLRNGSRSANQELLGGGQMPIFPTALSILTSFLSGILILGVPAEIYEHGGTMWIYLVAGVLSLIVNALLFLPVLYRLRFTSLYEYFEHRFDSGALRRIAASLFLLNSLSYTAIVMYAPAVAFGGFTGVPIWVFILTVGGVSTFYTSVGGLRGVVWTDTFQAFLMLGGLLALLAKGTHDVGGLGEVFREASHHNRLTTMTNLDPNPLQYFSFWIALFGGFGFWLAQYGLNQIAIQRYWSMGSFREAMGVVAITVPSFFILVTLSCLIGLVMFAYFNHCDPMKNQGVKKDQLVLLMVSESLGDIPGLAGLFLACLCSGTLSTISSGINSMSAILWVDFLSSFQQLRDLDDKNQSLVIKFLSFIFGALATGMAFACEPLGGLVKSATSILGSLSSPVVGLFLLGILVPRANRIGAFCGLAVTCPLLAWLCIGNSLYSPYSGYRLETFLDNCSNGANGSGSETVYHGSRRISNYGDASVFFAYRISNWLYPTIGIALILIIGSLSSLCSSESHNNEFFREKNEENFAEAKALNLFAHWRSLRKRPQRIGNSKGQELREKTQEDFDSVLYQNAVFTES